MDPDLVTNNLEGHLTIPAGLITSEDQIPSDQVQPLEQWLLSKGSVCASADLSYSSQKSFYLNHSHRANSSLSADADIHSMFHNPTVDFTKTPHHKQPRPQLGEGYQGMPSEHNLQNLGPSSASRQFLITSSNVHRSGLRTVVPVQFPESTSSEMSPQHTLTKVPSNSLSIEEGLVDPDPHKVALLKTASKSVATSNLRSSQGEVSLKPGPEEENELTFQTIGLQDITLDDGKALKHRC